MNVDNRENAKLDLVLSNIKEYPTAKQLSPICNNDHCCILLESRRAKKTPKYIKTNKRLVTPERKLRVLRDLALEPWDEVLNAPTVHDKIRSLHSVVNTILDRHCPMKVRKIRRDKPGWMTPSLEKLVRKRDKAFRSKSPKWRKLRSIAQRRIRASKREFINRILNTNQYTREWWATLKTITQPNSNSSEKSSPFIEGRAMNVNTFCDKLNELYIAVGGDCIPVSGVSATAAAEGSLQPLSVGEVKTLLGRLDPGKATSSEDFPTWVSLEGREDLCIPLSNIINSMLKSAEFLDFWKRAEVRPIPKNANLTLFKDYRPVAMLFHLGKLSEQVLIDKMKSKLESIIEPSQYAYQPNIGTIDALKQLLDDFTQHLDNPSVKYIRSAALDFSKAFDRLQPPTLIKKMRYYDFNPAIVSLVSSFLENRKQCVKYGNCKSSYKDNKIGAPQGTKLGPILWLIYSNDLKAEGFQHIKYADDTTFRPQ